MPIGAILKSMHYKFASPFLIIGLILTLGYIFLGIVEVQQSKRIAASEKLMWTIGFLFFGFLTGLLYLINGQKRVMNSSSMINER